MSTDNNPFHAGQTVRVKTGQGGLRGHFQDGTVYTVLYTSGPYVYIRSGYGKAGWLASRFEAVADAPRDVTIACGPKKRIREFRFRYERAHFARGEAVARRLLAEVPAEVTRGILSALLNDAWRKVAQTR